MEGGAEQTTAAAATIGQHQRNVAAQGEIPDLNSFSFCWGWDTPLLQAARAYAAMVKACVG